MIRIAHIENDVVTNISVWDGITTLIYPTPTVEIPEGLPVGIGWGYVGGEFIDTSEKLEQPDLPEEQE